MFCIPENEKASLTAFTPEAYDLLSRKLGLNEYALLLVDLYGVRTLNDLSELDSSDIDDIVKHVREGLFGQVDFSSKSTRIRYLGADYPNVGSFDFKPMDRKKLLKVNILALEEIASRKEKESTNKLLKATAKASANASTLGSNSSTQSTILSELDRTNESSDPSTSSTQQVNQTRKR